MVNLAVRPLDDLHRAIDESGADKAFPAPIIFIAEHFGWCLLPCSSSRLPPSCHRSGCCGARIGDVTFSSAYSLFGILWNVGGVDTSVGIIASAPPAPAGFSVVTVIVALLTAAMGWGAAAAFRMAY